MALSLLMYNERSLKHMAKEYTEVACTCADGWHVVGVRCPNGGEPILINGDDWP